MCAITQPADPIGVLRQTAERVEQLARPPHRPAQPDLDWYHALEDAVLELSHALPEGPEDYDARKLFEFLVGLRRAVAAGSDPEVELAALKLGDVVRRITRRLEHEELDDPRAAADSVFATLRNVGVGDLSRLLGVSTKTVNAWRAGRPVTRNADRVVVLAQLLTYLRASMTLGGLVMWFDAPRHQLGGRTPLELLSENEATAREVLVSLARGARGQLAS